MAAVHFGFGAPVAAVPRSVVLYPSTVNRYTAGGRSTTFDTEVKPFSCHRDTGKLFLKIDASYARALKVSEVLRDNLVVAPYSFVTKVFPEANCEWPQKPEVTLEVSLLHQPEPVNPYGARVEQLVQNNRVFGKYVLKLTASKMPPDFKVELWDCKVQSIDQKNFPMFCESFTNSPPNSYEAILRLQSTSHITVSFELRLTSIKPIHNAFDAAVSLSARLLRSAKSTGDILLKTQGGLQVPAHMAVLSGVPFFQTHFGPEWKGQPVVGEPATCMLPVEADEETLRLFLSYVYGEPHSLDAIKSHTILQSLFSLGEACDLAVLCKDVADVTKVKENEISDWVDWLNKEHLSEVQLIKDQVATLVKESVLAKQKFWEELSMEELRHIYNAAKRQKCTN